MEEEIDPSPEYIKKFNEGYLLKKYSPEIAEIISGIKIENSELISAIKAGIEQQSLESFDNKTLPWLNKDHYDEPSIDVEKDDLDIEP